MCRCRTEATAPDWRFCPWCGRPLQANTVKLTNRQKASQLGVEGVGRCLMGGMTLAQIAAAYDIRKDALSQYLHGEYRRWRPPPWESGEGGWIVDGRPFKEQSKEAQAVSRPWRVQSVGAELKRWVMERASPLDEPASEATSPS